MGARRSSIEEVRSTKEWKQLLLFNDINRIECIIVGWIFGFDLHISSRRQMRYVYCKCTSFIPTPAYIFISTKYLQQWKRLPSSFYWIWVIRDILLQWQGMQTNWAMLVFENNSKCYELHYNKKGLFIDICQN